MSTAEMQVYTMEETNATTTQTLVNAAKRLADELARGHTGRQGARALAQPRRAATTLPAVWSGRYDPEHLGQAGTAWQVFPNFQIGQGLTTALCYSARPNGYDPDSCIFEAACYELYPKGQEPQTEWDVPGS